MISKVIIFQVFLVILLQQEVLGGCSTEKENRKSKKYSIDNILLPYLQQHKKGTDCEFDTFKEHMSKYVEFYHYTKTNKDKPNQIVIDRPKSLSKWVKNQPVRILIHGFTEDSDSSSVQDVMEAYLKYRNYNIIAVDWSEISQSYCYEICVSKVDAIGKYTADLIKYLIKSPANVKLSDIQLIGHSLGAHIAGAAGKYMGNQKIPVIYGLDPAGPLFRNVDVKKRLDPTDAEYVEAIHTDAQDGYGIDENVGHVDFYVNGGCNQPECAGHYIRYYTSIIDEFLPPVIKSALNLCSHGESVVLFADVLKIALKNNKSDYDSVKGIYGTECKNIEDAFEEKCPTGPRVARRKIGDLPNSKARGIYQVLTTE